MFRCTKIFKFDAAHILDSAFTKKCLNVHGHTYKVGITLRRRDSYLDEHGMVIDFGLVSAAVNHLINDWLDHSLLVSSQTCNAELKNLKSKFRVCIFDFNPTAENLAKYIYDEVKKVLSDPKISVEKVRVYETETCWAEFSEEPY